MKSLVLSILLGVALVGHCHPHGGAQSDADSIVQADGGADGSVKPDGAQEDGPKKDCSASSSDSSSDICDDDGGEGSATTTAGPKTTTAADDEGCEPGEIEKTNGNVCCVKGLGDKMEEIGGTSDGERQKAIKARDFAEENFGGSWECFASKEDIGFANYRVEQQHCKVQGSNAHMLCYQNAR